MRVRSRKQALGRGFKAAQGKDLCSWPGLQMHLCTRPSRAHASSCSEGCELLQMPSTSHMRSSFSLGRTPYGSKRAFLRQSWPWRAPAWRFPFSSATSAGEPNTQAGSTGRVSARLSSKTLYNKANSTPPGAKLDGGAEIATFAHSPHLCWAQRRPLSTAAICSLLPTIQCRYSFAVFPWKREEHGIWNRQLMKYNVANNAIGRLQRSDSTRVVLPPLSRWQKMCMLSLKQLCFICHCGLFLTWELFWSLLWHVTIQT